MALKPPSEENGRAVLDIYARLERGEGESLMAKNLLAVAHRRRIAVDDLQSGVDYAVRTGWIERTGEGFLMLTRAGQQELPR